MTKKSRVRLRFGGLLNRGKIARLLLFELLDLCTSLRPMTIFLQLHEVRLFFLVRIQIKRRILHFFILKG